MWKWRTSLDSYYHQKKNDTLPNAYSKATLAAYTLSDASFSSLLKNPIQVSAIKPLKTFVSSKQCPSALFASQILKTASFFSGKNATKMTLSFAFAVPTPELSIQPVQIPTQEFV